MCTTRSPDQHRPSTTTVTMASHTGISVSAILGVVISSLVYPELLGLSPVEELSALEQDSTSRLSHTHGANDIPLELPLKRVFPGNIPTGLTKFILPQKRSQNLGHFCRQLGRCPLDSVIPLHQLWMNVMARYPHTQV